MKISLPGNNFTLVDKDDFLYLNQYKWHLGNGYVRRTTYSSGNKKNIRMHRVIMRSEKGCMVDHINGNKLDNRKENLRICTHQENMRNRKIPLTNKTGYKGIREKKFGKKWEVQIGVNHKNIYLGTFSNKQEAIRIYSIAAKKYFGDFMRK